MTTLWLGKDVALSCAAERGGRTLTMKAPSPALIDTWHLVPLSDERTVGH